MQKICTVTEREDLSFSRKQIRIQLQDAEVAETQTQCCLQWAGATATLWSAEPAMGHWPKQTCPIAIPELTQLSSMLAPWQHWRRDLKGTRLDKAPGTRSGTGIWRLLHLGPQRGASEAESEVWLKAATQSAVWWPVVHDVCCWA